MEPVDLAEFDEPDAVGARRWWPLLVGILAVVAVGAVILVTRSSDLDDEPAAVESADPTLAGAASATRGAATSRVALISSYEDEQDDATILTGVMSFGAGGVGEFESEPRDDEIMAVNQVRALPDATYLRVDGDWLRFSNEDFTLDNGIRFPAGQNALLGTIELLISVLDHADPSTVRTVGPDVSHGDAVTVFTAEVDLLEAFRTAGEVVDEIAAGGAFDDLDPEVTVWLDEQGRARLVRLKSARETMEVEFWDFGVEVNVEAPLDHIDDEDFRSSEAVVVPVDRDGTATPTADFCGAWAGLRPATAVGAPEDRAKDWFVAQAQVEHLRDLAPIELVPLADRLVDVYGSIGAEIDRGATISQLVEDGVTTGDGLVDWHTLLAIETGFHRAAEEDCHPA